MSCGARRALFSSPAADGKPAAIFPPAPFPPLHAAIGGRSPTSLQTAASLQPPQQQGLGGALASAPPAAAPLATGGSRQTALDPLEAVFSPVVWHDMAATSPSGTLDQTWRTSPGFSPSF